MIFLVCCDGSLDGSMDESWKTFWQTSKCIVVGAIQFISCHINLHSKDQPQLIYLINLTKSHDYHTPHAISNFDQQLINYHAHPNKTPCHVAYALYNQIWQIRL
jgi:hypothetical protein